MDLEIELLMEALLIVDRQDALCFRTTISGQNVTRSFVCTIRILGILHCALQAQDVGQQLSASCKSWSTLVNGG